MNAIANTCGSAGDPERQTSRKNGTGRRLGKSCGKVKRTQQRHLSKTLPMPCCVPLRICANAFRTQNRVDGLKGNECGRSNAPWGLIHGILFLGTLKPPQLHHISLSVSRGVLVRHTHRTNTFISGSAQLAGR